MEQARHDSEDEIDPRELFNYVASAQLLDKVPNKDGKTIEADKIRKGFFKPRLAPILEIVEINEPFDCATGRKIPSGQWDANECHSQDQGGYEWRVTERLVDFCAVHFCSGQGSKGTVMPPVQFMTARGQLFAKLVDALTHISDPQKWTIHYGVWS